MGPSKKFSQKTFDPVSPDRSPSVFPDRQTQTGSSQMIGFYDYHEMGESNFSVRFGSPKKIAPFQYPYFFGKKKRFHRIDKKGAVPGSQTDSLFLPLARLLLITLRPPAVLIRTKNPCVLDRFRLLG